MTRLAFHLLSQSMKDEESGSAQYYIKGKLLEMVFGEGSGNNLSLWSRDRKSTFSTLHFVFPVLQTLSHDIKKRSPAAAILWPWWEPCRPVKDERTETCKESSDLTLSIIELQTPSCSSLLQLTLLCGNHNSNKTYLFRSHLFGSSVSCILEHLDWHSSSLITLWSRDPGVVQHHLMVFVGMHGGTYCSVSDILFWAIEIN